MHVRKDKKKKKKIASKTSMPPDQKSLTMKILRAQLVSHSWVNCPDCNWVIWFLSNGWIFVDRALQPLWYEGASLPSEEHIQTYLWEESEVLRGILQNSEEIDENLVDDHDDVVSDNEKDQWRY